MIGFAYNRPWRRKTLKRGKVFFNWGEGRGPTAIRVAQAGAGFAEDGYQGGQEEELILRMESLIAFRAFVMWYSTDLGDRFILPAISLTDKSSSRL